MVQGERGPSLGNNGERNNSERNNGEWEEAVPLEPEGPEGDRV